MSTRSDVIVEHANGTWKRIYCHWDGYLEGVGRTLHENYDTQQKVEALVKPGDMSSLHEKSTKPEGHTFDKPVKGYTVYYGRDRGETDVDGTTGNTLIDVWPEEDSWTEFTYVWKVKEASWFVTYPDEGTQTLVPLAQALGDKIPVTPKVKVPFLGPIGKHAAIDKKVA